MSNSTQNGASSSFDAAVTFRLPALANCAAIKDAGQVRLGGFGPAFRSVEIVDAGKVRVGGFGPMFRSPAISDAGKVRMGGFGPVFR